MAVHLHLHLRLLGKDRPRVISSRAPSSNCMVTGPISGAIEPLEPIRQVAHVCCLHIASVVRSLSAARHDVPQSEHLDEGWARARRSPVCSAATRSSAFSTRRAGHAHAPGEVAEVELGIGEVEQAAGQRSAGVGAHPVQLHVQDGVAPVGEERPSSRSGPRGPGSTAPAACTWRCRPPAGRGPGAPAPPPRRRWPWAGRCRWRRR